MIEISFHQVPYSHLIFMLICWISMLLYTRILYVLRSRKRDFKSTYFVILQLHAINDYAMFFFVEFVARPRKYKIHNLITPITNNWFPQTIYFTQTLIKNSMFFGYMVIALNRFTCFLSSKIYRDMWTSLIIFSIFLTEWIAPATLLVPMFYMGNHNFSFLENQNGEIVLRASTEFMKLDALEDLLICSFSGILCLFVYIVIFADLIKKSHENASADIPEYVIFKSAIFSFLLFTPNAVKTLILYHATNSTIINIGTELWFFTTELMCISTPWSLYFSSRRLREQLIPRRFAHRRQKISTIVLI